MPSVLDLSGLRVITEASDRIFTHIEQLIRQYGADRVKEHLPNTYNYLERSTSVSPIALADYLNPREDILNLFANSLGMTLLGEILGREVVCNLTKSRVTKQYAPVNYHALHLPNQWHQDGALGVSFPTSDSLTSAPYISAAMTAMVICWIPLVDCFGDRPSLEFIKQPCDRLLHYDYLNDRKLENLFAPKDFWVPELKQGDMLIFLNGTLHRTYVTEAMKSDRTSIELRFMPSQQIPPWMQSDRFAQIPPQTPHIH
ncbi:hypothetical protein V2H45_10915 [Tumidithrix elongata RA019]|uniref:Phytanoyl-CoA dioxygenase n=1 Tax=Tumidithrix elongata BACA0141 TaxID=2716417 RepID=A0AAW9PZ78_9CYAN|nr:hypothetical protein [Tumidithrix elongata RA019]